MVCAPSCWWLLILVVVVVLDFGGRVLFAFDMKRVALFESALFAGACVLMAGLSRRYRPTALWAARVQAFVCIVFGLGALRAILWAAGVRVVIANLETLAAAIVLIAVIAVRRRVAARQI